MTVTYEMRRPTTEAEAIEIIGECLRVICGQIEFHRGSRQKAWSGDFVDHCKTEANHALTWLADELPKMRWEDKRGDKTVDAVDPAPSDCTTASLKADKIMTRKEYFDLPLYHWHSVCWDYDGVGSVGIKYDGRSPPKETQS